MFLLKKKEIVHTYQYTNETYTHTNTRAHTVKTVLLLDRGVSVRKSPSLVRPSRAARGFTSSPLKEVPSEPTKRDLVPQESLSDFVKLHYDTDWGERENWDWEREAVTEWRHLLRGDVKKYLKFTSEDQSVEN